MLIKNTKAKKVIIKSTVMFSSPSSSKGRQRSGYRSLALLQSKAP